MNKFFQLEFAGSLLMGVAVIFALTLANGPLTSAGYLSSLQFKLGGLSVEYWINDGLMAIFFYLVGMEIKKEMISGSLSSFKKALLPLFSALGGMIVPALIFLLINREPAAREAWGIPMATDIAFAVGVLVAIGHKAPVQIRALLLALAVIDDLGAIVIIAIFYSKGLTALWLGGFAACGLANLALLKFGRWNWWLHGILGVIAWACMLWSGIHATLAGVIWGFLTPHLLPKQNLVASPLEKGIHVFHPYVNFLILPVFALANAGVILPTAADLSVLISNSLFWAVGLGLLIGKPLGIALFTWICLRAGLADLPDGLKFRSIWGLGMLAGIGFTMALFITQLSLADASFHNFAKLGILMGSILSGLAAWAFFQLKILAQRDGT